MNARSSWNLRAALTLFLGASLIPVAVAQSSTAANSTDEETVKLEKFVVTGSLIPIAADTPAIPITVLSSNDIKNTGVATDLLDVIRKAQPNFYGANNVGSDNGNISSGSTNGGSAVALRNRATLVLINGRRVAVSPVVASGGGNFVDVSLIPMNAVERIEILSDGASATYGSDAVSGVVNIIMKTTYSGFEVGGYYGWAPGNTNWANRSYYAIGGASNGKTSVTISTEWKKSDPLIQRDREWGRGQFRTPSFAGSINIGNDFYYLNPSLNAPPQNLNLSPADLVAQGIYQGPLTQDQVAQFFDLADYPTMLIAAKRRSFTAAIDHQLSDTTRLFADFIYTMNETRSVLNAQPVSGSVVSSNASNPFDRTVTARNRFVTFPRIYDNKSQGLRGVVGIKGSIGDKWNYEFAGSFNRTLHNFRNSNLIDAVTYNAAVTAGTYNPFARRQNPGVVESFLGTSFRDYSSELNGFDLRVTGEVFELPAGPVMVGFGAETRWEHLKFDNDRYDQTGQWLQATPRQPFSARSNTDGLFAEVRAPIFDKSNSITGFHTLEVSVAGRKDIYSKTSDPFVPKYTLRWLPFNDEFAVRGTYSESFSAPTLYDLLGPISQGFTAGINITRYDTSGNSLNTTTGSRQYRSRSGSNANLNPSESRNWTAGVVWSPKKIKGLEVSFDWFSIDERDLVSSISSSLIVSSVEQFGAASPYASLVRVGTAGPNGEARFTDGAPITTPGMMSNRPSDEVWISNQLVNLAGVWQSGADFSVRYRYDTGDMGVLNFGVTGTHIKEYYIQSLPTSAPVEYSGRYSGTSAYANYRTYSTVAWTYKNMRAQLAHTFVPELAEFTNPVRNMDSYHQVDVNFSYDFSKFGNRWLQGLTVTAGMNNVFDEPPPYSATEGNQNRDIRAYDPIGRMVYFQGRYKF
jgi:iron complex outermembrane recepter protein